MSQGEVNWRIGTASVYESNWSLARKYCYLNRIYYRSIDNDLFELMDDVRKNRSPKQAGSEVVALPLRLGEPQTVIRYRKIEQYLLPRIIIGDDVCWSPEDLRYCPVCMNRGYHSPIHQLPWVAYCPLHGVPLMESCGICGNKIELRRWPDNWRNNPRRKAKKGECYCDLWPTMRNSAWPRGICRAEARPIGQYLKWLDLLSRSPQAQFGKEAIAGLASCCSSDIMLELFNIWRKILPPPPAVNAFLVKDNGWSGNSFVTTFRLSEDQSTALLDLIRHRGYRQLIYGLAVSHGMRNQKGAWDFVLKRIVRDFSGPHLNCLHGKELAKKEQLLASFFPLEDVFLYCCHRVSIVEILKAKWICLSGLGFRLESIMDSSFDPEIHEILEQELLAAGLAKTEKSPKKKASS